MDFYGLILVHTAFNTLKKEEFANEFISKVITLKLLERKHIQDMIISCNQSNKWILGRHQSFENCLVKRIKKIKNYKSEERFVYLNKLTFGLMFLKLLMQLKGKRC